MQSVRQRSPTLVPSRRCNNLTGGFIVSREVLYAIDGKRTAVQDNVFFALR